MALSLKLVSSLFCFYSFFAEDDEEAEDEWPPFRKVGHFDPFSDDPRLAVKKVAFCSKSGNTFFFIRPPPELLPVLGP